MQSYAKPNQSRTIPIDFPFENELANAFPTVTFRNKEYCIPFDGVKRLYSKKLYARTPTQIYEVCEAPSVDTFGYTVADDTFLAFDWPEKQFYIFDGDKFIPVDALNELKLSRVHIAKYKNLFVIIDWDNPTIYLVDSDLELVQKVNLGFDKFQDWWLNAIIDDLLVLYVRQGSIGRHVLLDIGNMVAQKVPSTIVFPWSKDFHWFADHKIQQFRRPFIFRQNGSIMLWKGEEFFDFKDVSKHFNGFDYE